MALLFNTSFLFLAKLGSMQRIHELSTADQGVNISVFFFFFSFSHEEIPLLLCTSSLI
jgi:hypothetical protein